MYFQERAACASIRLVIRSIGSAMSTVLCTCARTGGGESNWRNSAVTVKEPASAENTTSLRRESCGLREKKPGNLRAWR